MVLEFGTRKEYMKIDAEPASPGYWCYPIESWKLHSFRSYWEKKIVIDCEYRFASSHQFHAIFQDGMKLGAWPLVTRHSVLVDERFVFTVFLHVHLSFVMLCRAFCLFVSIRSELIVSLPTKAALSRRSIIPLSLLDRQIQRHDGCACMEGADQCKSTMSNSQR